MMQIEIKLTADPILIAVLDKIAGALMESAETVNAGWKIQEHDKAQKPALDVVKNEKPAQVEPEVVEEEPATDAKSVSLEDVRAELARLNKAGKKETTKALLTKYGADKLSEIKPEHFAALYAEARTT